MRRREMDTLYGTPFAPLGPRWSGHRGETGSVPGANMRVSDAERSEVADELSKHYAEGRLDQSEFNERLSKAMAAKTRGDFAGLLDDLPRPQTRVPAVPPHRLLASRALGLTLFAFLFLAASSALWSFGWHWHLGFLFVVVAALVLWRRHAHLHWHDGHSDPTHYGPTA
jgi:hypothetical protein